LIAATILSVRAQRASTIRTPSGPVSTPIFHLAFERIEVVRNLVVLIWTWLKSCCACARGR
jgi:hypothetical protein